MNNSVFKTLTVSECVDLVRTTLQSVVGELVVTGEVSEFKRQGSSQLIFFSLKDESSYLRCFMLGHELREDLADGVEVRVYGYPSLFKKNAGFHLRVRAVEFVGEGALRKQLELTKKKLEQEGLFAPSRKRAIPAFPMHIGIITSENAAAYTDVHRVLSNRWPLATLTLVQSQVQGKPAIKQLLKAFDSMEQNVKPELIILTRGGGSLEDLQAFNSEDLARRIFSCEIPVISGVGHERDWTIADLVADVRAATPSNAAELAVPKRQDILMKIDALFDGMEYRIRSSLQERLHELHRSTSTLSGAMQRHLKEVHQTVVQVQSFGNRIIERVQFFSKKLFSTEQTLISALNLQSRRWNDRLQSLSSLIKGLSPRSLLKRGYSITKKKGAIVRSSSDVRKGDILTTTVTDGDIVSEAQ